MQNATLESQYTGFLELLWETMSTTERLEFLESTEGISYAQRTDPEALQAWMVEVAGFGDRIVEAAESEIIEAGDPGIVALFVAADPRSWEAKADVWAKFFRSLGQAYRLTLLRANVCHQMLEISRRANANGPYQP